MFIVEHNIAFHSVDHLTNLLKEAANHPEAVKSMTLKRTKCTAVVKNVTGFAADGTNSLMGSQGSSKVLLEKDVPSLFVLKCICHSVAFCSSYACNKLPRGPEDLVRDIHGYFKNSYKRVTEFKEFQEFVEAKPHKLLRKCDTPWLSL
ncbi:hypothetical protein JTB14_011481 [Gonioctena quinquepunctata]|nr:hypothetical protein JTB14_011481 [Gonioctena quinquepunctata]